MSRVIGEEALLANILLHADDKSWMSYFLVERAWLPIVTRLRCRHAGLNVSSWKRDCLWHESVIDSIRWIRSATGHTGTLEERFADWPRISQVREMFDYFPLLHTVSIHARHVFEPCRGRADYTFDRETGTGHVAFQQNRMAYIDVLPVRQAMWPALVDDMIPEGWTITRSITLVVTGSESPEEDARGVPVDVARASLSDLTNICNHQSRTYPSRPITRLEGNQIEVFEVKDFDDLAVAVGEHLVDFHLHLDGPPSFDGVTYRNWSSGITLNGLSSVIDTVIDHMPRLANMIIPIEEYHISRRDRMDRPSRRHLPASRCLQNIRLELKSKFDLRDDPNWTLDYPLVGIARNLAFIADSDTRIEFAHFDDRSGAIWELEHTAGVISGIIAHIRALPDSHIQQLLSADLAGLGVAQNDYVLFTELAFYPDGRPVPRNVQLDLNRLAILHSAWHRSGREISPAAADEIRKCRKRLSLKGFDTAVGMPSSADPARYDLRLHDAESRAATKEKELSDALKEIAALEEQLDRSRTSNVCASSRVFAQANLLTHILRYVDEASWSHVFLVCKAWLPAVARYRCVTANGKVNDWQRDSLWHSCVIDSIRISRTVTDSPGTHAESFDVDKLRKVPLMFDRFPLLRQIHIIERDDVRLSIKASATWTYDRLKQHGHLSLLLPVCRSPPFAQDSNQTLCVSEVQPKGWTSEVSVRLTLLGPDLDAGVEVFSDDDDNDDDDDDDDTDDDTDDDKFFPLLGGKCLAKLIDADMTALSMNGVGTTISSLSAALASYQDRAKYGPITSLECDRVNPFCTAAFQQFAENCGARLRHLHLHHGLTATGEDEWVDGLTSDLEFGDLASLIETTAERLVELRTMTIALEDDFVTYTKNRLPAVKALHSSRTLQSLQLLLRQPAREESFDDPERSREVGLPLLWLARNLAFIADGDTKITIRCFESYYDMVWETLEFEAEQVSDVISFVRSLPESHMSSLLDVDLENLGIEPNDMQDFLQLTFRSDGRPVPRRVQRMMDRYAAVCAAWNNGEAEKSRAAAMEVARLRKRLMEAGETEHDIDRLAASGRGFGSAS